MLNDETCTADTKPVKTLIICPIAVAEHETNYKIASVFLSFCLSGCKHSYGRNFDSILMKFCTVIRGPKSKIEFILDKNLITPFLFYFLFYLNFFFKNYYGLWEI